MNLEKQPNGQPLKTEKSVTDTGSLDAFLAEIKPSEDAVMGEIAKEEEIAKKNDARKKDVGDGSVEEEVAKKDDKAEKPKSRFENLVDSIAKIRESLVSKIIPSSIRVEEYIVLACNKDEYLKFRKERVEFFRKLNLELSGLREQATKEYNSTVRNSNYKDLKDKIDPNPSIEVYANNTMRNDMRGNDPVNTYESDFNSYRNTLSSKIHPYGYGQHFALIYGVKNQYEYITKLISNAISYIKLGSKYETDSMYQSFEWKKKDMEITCNRTGQAFGIIALEHGDVVVAAKSLALADTVGEIPADVQEQMRALYEKLDGAKKTEFGIALAKEKRVIKQAMEEAIKEGLAQEAREARKYY